MRLNPLSNFPLRLGAVLLALLLWVHVATNKSYEYNLEVPVRVQNVPDGLVLTSEFPQFVNVRVKGTGKQLLSLLSRDAELTIDISDAKEGTMRRELGFADVAALFDGSYDDLELMSPRVMTLKLEREIERRLRVEPNLFATAAEGFVIMNEPAAEPASVTAVGPVSVFRHLESLSTEPKDLKDLTESVTETLRLVVPDTLRIRVDSPVVLVSITVDRLERKAFPWIGIVPPRGFNTRQYGFEPDSLTLLLGIPRSLLDSVSEEDIRITFSVPGNLTDSLKAALQYTLPRHVEFINSPPDSVLIIRKL